MTATPLLRDAAVSVRYSLRGSGPLSRRRSFRLPSSTRAASKRRDQNVPADREYYRVPARVLPTHAAPSCATPAVCSAQGQDGVRAAAGTARIPLACNIQHTKPMQQATSPVHHPPPIYGFTIKNVDDAPVGLPVGRRSFPHMSLPATLRTPVAPWGGVDGCMRQPSRAAIGRSCVHGVVSTACVRSHAQANCVGSAAGRAGELSRVRTGCDGRSYELAHTPPLLTTDCPWLGLRR